MSARVLDHRLSQPTLLHQRRPEIQSSREVCRLVRDQAPEHRDRFVPATLLRQGEPKAVLTVRGRRIDANGERQLLERAVEVAGGLKCDPETRSCNRERGIQPHRRPQLVDSRFESSVTFQRQPEIVVRFGMIGPKFDCCLERRQRTIEVALSTSGSRPGDTARRKERG